MVSDHADVSALQASLAQRTRQLQSIHRITAALGSVTKVGEVVREALRVSLECVGARDGSVILHDPTRDKLVFAYVIGEKAADLIGVELDPGNQAFEGYERWELSVGLLGEYLRAVGIKDTAITRDPARAAEPGKGWARAWATLEEGETNWYDLLRALRAGEFEGHFVWMPFYDEHDPAEMTRKLTGEVAYIRKAAAEVEAEAEAAK